MKKILSSTAILSTLFTLSLLLSSAMAATCEGPGNAKCTGDCCEVTATGCKAGPCPPPPM